MKSIILIRHGETEWNNKYITQWCYNVSLTLEGINQGKKIINRLLTMKRDYKGIYSSELDRCKLIADMIGKSINLKVITDKSLNEMNFGLWEGLTIKEIQERYNEEYNLWRTYPHKAVIPQGETLELVQKRSMDFIKGMIPTIINGSVIIVSHSVVIKSMILGILNIGLENFYKFSIENGSISEIEFRKYGPVLKLLNETSHLFE